MTVPEKRTALLQKVVSLLEAHHNEATDYPKGLPPIKSSRYDRTHHGDTSLGNLYDIIGNPACYVSVSPGKDHRRLVAGSQKEIHATDVFTLTFWLEFRSRVDGIPSGAPLDYGLSSEALWERVLYADGKSATFLLGDNATEAERDDSSNYITAPEGLLFWLRNDRVLPVMVYQKVTTTIISKSTNSVEVGSTTEFREGDGVTISGAAGSYEIESVDADSNMLIFTENLASDVEVDAEVVRGEIMAETDKRASIELAQESIHVMPVATHISTRYVHSLAVDVRVSADV